MQLILIMHQNLSVLWSDMIYMNLINKIFLYLQFVTASALGSENDEMVLKAYDAIHDNRLTSVRMNA